MIYIITLIVTVLIVFGLLFVSTTATSVYAQEVLPTPTLPSTKTPTTPALSPSSSSLPSPLPKLHAVRIVSPSKGQQIPISNNTNNSLVISGTSLANATSHCQVTVIANDVKPYQPAKATGSGGPNDYSKWNFVLTSKYTTIKEGQNKITAKYSCGINPKLVSFYSVNVSGVAAAPTTAVKQLATNNGTIPSNSTSTSNSTNTATNASSQQQQLLQAAVPSNDNTR